MRARLSERVEDVAGEFARHPFVHEILDFIREGKDRAICTPRDPGQFGRLMPREAARSRSSPGPGSFPIQLVDHLERTGQDCRVLAFRGFAAAELRRRAHATVDLLDLKTIMSTLEGWRPQRRLPRRRRAPARLLRACSAPIRCLRNMQEVKEVIARGDDQVLRGAVMLLEERGHRVVGAHELAPDLVASRTLTGARAARTPRTGTPSRSVWICSHRCPPSTSARAPSSLAEHVLAIEGPEGTDRMLRRVTADAPILVRPAPSRRRAAC